MESILESKFQETLTLRAIYIDDARLGQDISAVAVMPDARNHFATVVNNGLIYAMGEQYGHDGCRTPTQDDVQLVYVFDPQTS